MGIPKFYRWLSERYPLLNQRFTATEGAPDIDNLYLDMNGIIHNCTHANQKEVKMNEEEMMLKIFDYIDKLVQIIRPKKLLFMAIDGVAPRAKMNQQRSRRFKSAKERLEAEAEKRRKGEEVPADPFDSNCITPGTPFMERLGKHLRFFIRRKMSEDLLWQTPTVVFSGHDVPGEGEHKIMEYLRWEKRSPNFQPNQRHCLYGLDADLIMLSLVTHEPHFCLLREIVSYTGGNRGQPARETLDNPCAENFILFHIGLLREYFEAEFTSVSVPFEANGQVNIERVVDDFVLFCMLVGNDFLPPLPTLDIAEGALNNMMSLYKELLPSMGGYLTHAGYLDRSRLEKLLGRLGQMEQEVLEERAKDAEYMEGKKAKRAANAQEGYVPPAARAAAAALARNAASTGSLAQAAAATAAAMHPAASTPDLSHAANGTPGGSRIAAGPTGDGKGFGGPQARRALLNANGDSPSPGDAGSPVPDQSSNGAADTDGLTEGVAALSVNGTAPHHAPAEVPSGPLAAFFEAIGVADAALPLEDDEPAPVAAAEPTMMSKEARQLMLSGLGAKGLQMWKERWYTEKLNAKTPAAQRLVVESYVQGLHWVLEYYYRGVASWDWYYPYYYAPMASDMVKLEDIPVRFTQGKPFRPYEQLLSVLPSASAVLLPPAYQPLMLNPNSNIIDFYPTEFDVDMEGKRASWEGIVKVPFVDEARLLAAVAGIGDQALSDAEKQRNVMGQILVFQRSLNSKDTDYCASTMPKIFRDVVTPGSRLIRREVPPALPDGERGFTPTLVPGTKTGLECPKGYPTLKSLRVQAALRMAGVNVLGTPSRKESLILGLPAVGEGVKAATLAPVLGNRCYVNWPYLQEARVMRISDSEEQWVFTSHSQPQCKKWQSQEATKWRTEASAMASALLTRFGLDVGKVEIVMHIKVCKGYLVHPDGTVQKQYLEEEIGVPLQCVLRTRPGADAASASADASDAPALVTLKEGDRAVFLGKGHYGAVATILADLGQGMTKGGKPLKAAGTPTSYRISVHPLGPNGLDAAARAARVAAAAVPRYFPSHEVARKLRINPRVLGRITSNVWVTDGDERFDVGLAVRSQAKGLCVPGFVSPSQDGNGWQYSQAMLTVFSQYREAHPWLWEALDKQANAPPDSAAGGTLRLTELLPALTPEERKAKAAAAMKWVKSSPLAGKPLVKSSVTMMPDEAVKTLQLALPPKTEYPAVEFENVPPALLLPGFVPGPEQVKLSIQGGEFSLGDRVVCLLKAGIPAFGLHGTVIGVYEDALEIVFDHEFVGGTTLGGKVTGRCGAQVPKDIMLNISRPVTMPINKTHVPRPLSASAVRTSSLPPPAAAAAAAAARQAASATTSTAASRTVSAAAATQAAAAAARGRPVSAQEPVRTQSGRAGPAAPAGPAPPPPSAHIMARANSVPHRSHAPAAPKVLPHNAGAALLQQLQAGRVPPPSAHAAQHHVPVPHHHGYAHPAPPPPQPHPGSAPYMVHHQAALGHVPVHTAHYPHPHAPHHAAHHHAPPNMHHHHPPPAHRMQPPPPPPAARSYSHPAQSGMPAPPPPPPPMGVSAGILEKALQPRSPNSK